MHNHKWSLLLVSGHPAIVVKRDLHPPTHPPPTPFIILFTLGCVSAYKHSLILFHLSIIQTRKQLWAAIQKYQQCEFTEEYSDGYYQYKSVKYPQWFIGFSRKGKPRNGRKSANRQKHKHRQFMRYDRSGIFLDISDERRRRKHRCSRNHKKRKLARVNAGRNVKKSRKCGQRQGRKKPVRRWGEGGPILPQIVWFVTKAFL